MNRRVRNNRGAWAIVVAVATALGAGAVSGQQASEAGQQGAYLCVSCHASGEISAKTSRPHAASTSCLTCHHVGYSNDPGVIAERRLDACESCHGRTPLTHASFEPACTECHTIHADPAVAGPDLTEPGTCQSCHSTGHTLHSGVSEAPECGACHTVHGAPEKVLSQPYMEGRCETCHEAEAVHPSHAGVDALPCLECHDVNGSTTTLAADDVSAACESCHDSMLPTHESADAALLCTDCHEFGETMEAEEVGPVVSQRCGMCHIEELTEMQAGGHAAGVATGDPNTDLPNCMTCHTAHASPDSRAADVRLAATVRCIECHAQGDLIEEYDLPENVVASYLDDYHGATVKFLWNHPRGEDRPNVMVCSDCHGAHAVGWDPSTSMAPVCLECHEQGDEKLASAWVGHATVGPQNQFMVWMIRIFYYVMIPFVLGGLFLNVVLHLNAERRHGARMKTAPKITRLRAWLAGKRPQKPATVKRFSLRERAEHMAAAVIFILLVVTGLPQTAPTSEFANAIIELFGGIASTRLVHRIAGFTFVALLIFHVSRGVMGMLRNRRIPEIVPTRQDFQNLLQSVRHYVAGEPKPKIGKFDAAAKFEYWGLFFGGAIMTVTGIVLVYPELVSRVLPGEVVSAMRTMHGLEATFAVLVVLLWHTWSVILRPDIFPLDTSMFTGEIEVERLKEEHELEYERLKAEGEIEPEVQLEVEQPDAA